MVIPKVGMVWKWTSTWGPSRVVSVDYEGKTARIMVTQLSNGSDYVECMFSFAQLNEKATFIPPTTKPTIILKGD